MEIKEQLKKYLVANIKDLDNTGLWELEERIGADHFAIESHYWAAPFKSGHIKVLDIEDIEKLYEGLR